MKTLLLDRQQTLVQWVSQATGINTFGVKVRLLGNDLHILCEGTDCPQRWQTLSDLLQALQQTDLDSLTNEEQSPIYQVLVYGRKKGEYRPQWCHRVYLNQLDRHLEQVQQALLSESVKSKTIGVSGALIVSNESLARQGNPDAIARYLSENLSNLGVAVQVKSTPFESKTNSQKIGNRLWIFCQSSYSPDATLLAEPIAQQLRHLKLSGYEDAVIVSQVRGENAPDWRLRVDLTPPEKMLKEWARWGDVQAIARLLTEVLSDFKISVQAALKEFTLHIFCTPAVDPLKNAPAPEKEACLQVIVSQLEAIAPQGILAAAIYGQKTGDQQPAWVDWVSLPASIHPALATSTLALGSAGDEPAIIFLLERLLNHDMDWRLKTGGIRVLLLRKGDLLHVMCDAPNCPTRQQVATKVTQFIRQLNILGLTGVRIYGRRAGDSEPVWHHGVDFEQRHRLVPEATPEFAATSEYVNDLLTNETDEPIVRPDLTTQEVQSFVKEAAQHWLETAHKQVKKLLVETQLFADTNQAIEHNPDEQGVGGSFIWIALGFMLTLQTDWMLGYVINRIQNSPQGASILSSSSSQSQTSLTSGTDQSQRTAFFTSSNNTQSSQSSNSAFNASGFTQNDEAENLPNSPLKQKANSTAILLAARSRKAGASLTQMPSFGARQLDEQLALYKQRLATTGKPPDILIIGSSRALRGVDPVALTKALATQGYATTDVFNFGINGATAQVVDFIIRQVLQPSELPKLIIWADGSRAFNSGRNDITFNAIAASKGYQEVLKRANQPKNSDNLSLQETNQSADNKITDQARNVNTYEVANELLNQALMNISVSYKNRDQIKILLQKKLQDLPFNNNHQSVSSISKSATEQPEDESQLSVDFDGFLPLSIRFNPVKYYQKHPKVSGSYDNDYKSFQLAGNQDTALQSVIEFTKSQQIPIVFVNMPLTGDYLDPARTKYEQQFQQYMLNVSTTNANFIYRDLSQIWLKGHDYFSDPSHLNRYGAYEISKKLAIDPMIPWNFK
ncbi:DUF1574 domain-containing protein [Sphaerospermopsis aphanizomenoides BCCUSP55]|uniref:DUF1574 domain-containing protein n=1 Tax=Sphaerospermopsis aphanizomenoides TaxID=459663 RepID=UPI0019044BDE|nr:DUF1574 domain-containing protein [Sphaerospermopsis aphanizomenoides]MBK1988597.1 DUF1574 domain-containing protein [Sphaerospermopsis aphanizomenoides BCCUSP55]